MSTHLHIRAATPADIPLMTELVAALNFAEGNPVSIAPEALHTVIFGSDPRGQMRAMVAENEEKVVAVAIYYWGFDTVSATYGYHLADIVVAAQMRRKSIGKRLFIALGKQVLAEGGQWISLTAQKTNRVGQKFYKSLGMTKVSADFFAIGHTALTKLY